MGNHFQLSFVTDEHRTALTSVSTDILSKVSRDYSKGLEDHTVKKTCDPSHLSQVLPDLGKETSARMRRLPRSANLTVTSLHCVDM